MLLNLTPAQAWFELCGAILFEVAGTNGMRLSECARFWCRPR